MLNLFFVFSLPEKKVFVLAGDGLNNRSEYKTLINAAADLAIKEVKHQHFKEAILLVSKLQVHQIHNVIQCVKGN